MAYNDNTALETRSKAQVEKDHSRNWNRLKTVTPQLLVKLARDKTEWAIEAIIELADAPETPPAVKLRCYEIILERGYGKAPQAILVAEESVGGGGPGTIHQIPIMERIAMLKAAKDRMCSTLDLEANAVTEEDLRINPDPQQPIKDFDTLI
jgi:hypothetical protein